MIGIRKVSFLSAGLLALAACLASAPAYAAGECLEWNVTGSWHIAQSDGTNVTLRLQQNGTQLSGVGEYSHYNNDSHKVETIGGPVDGALEHGSFIRVTVFWSNSTAGHYTGQVEADGGMTGFTVDQNDPNNKATFHANGYPQCVSRAAEAPPPPAKPTMALGRVHLPPGTPATPVRTMCESAASARARNSPAAPALERRCAEERARAPAVALGRVVPARSAPPTPAPPTPEPPTPEPAAAMAPIDPAVLDTLAAKGAEIAGIDPPVAEARNAEAGMFYQLGFDIATGLFGDPALGAQGNTLMGPGSERIRDTLSAAGQRGFNDSVKFHLARDYRH